MTACLKKSYIACAEMYTHQPELMCSLCGFVLGSEAMPYMLAVDGDVEPTASSGPSLFKSDSTWLCASAAVPSTA